MYEEQDEEVLYAGPPGNFRGEVGGEGEAVTVPVSAGEALAHAKPTRNLNDRLNQEPLHGQTHKAVLHRHRLPLPPQDRPMSSNSNHLM